MIEIKNKRQCCGCEACAQICPKNCIKMVQDIEGFYYPEVDKAECIKCNKCNNVCPFINYTKPNNEKTKGFVVQSIHNSVLELAVSGGAYATIAKYIIDHGGISYGASYEHKGIVHTKADNEKELQRHYSSKYVQSRINGVYKEIQNYLNSDKIVLFSGTACQIVGLKKFLNKDYEKLYTIDVVCAGVCSPKIFEDYISELEHKEKSKVTYVNFRKKTYGYHSSTMTLIFENGKKYSQGRLTDPMMRIFTSKVANRPSCAKCAIKGKERISDITIFDAWSYEKLTGNKDNDRGHTNVLVHTNKGLDLLNKCQNEMNIEEIDVPLAIELDGDNIYNQNHESATREKFMDIYVKEGLNKAIEEVIPITFFDRVKECSKKYLYKLGLLDIIKRIAE